MAVADAHGLPIAIRTFGASTHEVKLAARTIESAYVKPQRVIGDKAYCKLPQDQVQAHW